MTVESAADRTALLADWGVAATLTPSGGAAVAVTVIHDQPKIDGDLPGRSNFRGVAHAALLRIDDAATDPKAGTLEIAATVYTILDTRRDEAAGFWLLQLQE